MHISSLTIDNYKSIFSVRDLRFTSGINVIVGRNNSGKTALLEALGMRFRDNAHRSLEHAPDLATFSPRDSIATVQFDLQPQELWSFVRYAPLHGQLVATCSHTQTNDFAAYLTSAVDAARSLRAIWRGDSLVRATLDRYEPELPQDAFDFHLALDKMPPQFQAGAHRGRFEASRSDQVPLLFTHRLAEHFRDRVYLFKAERIPVERGGIAPSMELVSNASNLPAVLHELYLRYPETWRQYIETVRRILPDIHTVVVHTADGGHCELFLWAVPPSPERSHLAIRLAESGTGVSQVLAILYVLLSAETPRTILIDEPNSFLHPGAVRSLIEVLREHERHQIIISTHSPTAIAAARPMSIAAVTKLKGVTQVRAVPVSETGELRELLGEVGARLSDVFGADRIFWVEGQTEEQCFPLIWSAHVKTPLLGTIFLALVDTGRLQRKRDFELALTVYERLTRASALLPPAVAFEFDRDSLTIDEQRDVAKRLGGRVYFTPRRMYENNLLHPAALASVLARSDQAGTHTTETVGQWLTAKRASKSDREWFYEEHGAEVLEKCFGDLTGGRVQYDKIRHGVMITEWLLSNEPEALLELAQMLEAAVSESDGLR